MKILAVESATRTLSVAVVEEGRVLAETSLLFEAGHSQLLVTIVDRLLGSAGLTLDDMEGFAVSIGPGSFTGLRVGLATVKGFLLARDRPVAAVGALEALALAWPGLVCPCLDARKGEVFAALYEHDGGPAAPGAALVAPGAYRPEELAEIIREILASRPAPQAPVVFAGDGLDALGGVIRQALGPLARPAPPHAVYPRAARVGHLGEAAILAGRTADPATLAPSYLRRSEAEIADQGKR